jgi:amino acid transporter
MRLKNYIKIEILVVIVLWAMLAAANLANAGFLNDKVKPNIDLDAGKVGENAGYESATGESALTLVQTVISVFISIIGVLLLVYILYAGYNWMTAEGEEEKVTRAKDTIKRAIIGAIIIIAAYAISTFVISRLEANNLKGGGGSGVNLRTNP